MQNEQDKLIEALQARRQDPEPKPLDLNQTGCPSITRLMNVALDRAASDEARWVKMHATECADCGTRLKAYRAFLADEAVTEAPYEGSVLQQVAESQFARKVRATEDDVDLSWPGRAPNSPEGGMSPDSPGVATANPLIDARQQLQESVQQVQMILDQLGQTDLADLLRERAARMTSHQFRLVVVGEYNCGKTTLINALLGREVLPTSPLPCTSVITTVQWSDERRATLHFRDPVPGTLLEQLPSVVLDYIRKAGGRPVPPLEVPVDHLREFITFTGLTKEGPKWSDSPYSRAEIGWPLDLCKQGTEISDTPGLDEYGYRDPALLECLRQADAVAFVMSCAALARPSEMRLLEQLRGLGLSNVFLICNRIDQMRPADREPFREFVRAKFRRFMDQTVLGTDGIFFLSALDALEGHLAGSQERVAASGLPELATALMRSLISDREGTIEETTRIVLRDVKAAGTNRIQDKVDVLTQLQIPGTRFRGGRTRLGAEAARN